MNYKLLNGIIDGIISGNRELYNPTYFYGPDGMVRDVLDTVFKEYKSKYPRNNALRVTADEYLMEFIRSVKDGTTEAFQKKYRKCDLLIFEHMEGLAAKNALMVEFYEMFDSIYMHGGQIVVGARVPPVKMEGLQDRIRTQLEGGMIFGVE